MRRSLTIAAMTLGWLALGLAAMGRLPGQSETANACGIYGPYDFDTYEAQNYVADYGRMIELAAAGQGITFDYTIAAGDYIDVRFQGLESGPRGSRTGASTVNTVPPTIMKSIVWNEAAWANAASSVPYGAVGPALRSFDCGYGLGQITSGMSNGTGTPSGRQAVIATHPLFNISEGIRILADKWNSAPEVRPVAGTGDPAALEDWYYAIWSYNGFAFSNHPMNPNRDVWRGELYHCYSQTAFAENPAWASFSRSAYTYPELVYGCMRYPPTRLGGLMWQPVTLQMPYIFAPEVFSSLGNPQHFLDCDGFIAGCPAMDYPTTIPEFNVVTHADTNPPGSAPASAFLRSPILAVFGPQTRHFIINSSGQAGVQSLSVANIGTYIAPFRIRTSAGWIAVRHPNDPATRTLDGGVAMGSDVIVSSEAGWPSNLIVTVDSARYPGGFQSGWVIIEPLFGGGGIYTLQITAQAQDTIWFHRNFVPGSSAKAQ